MQGGFPFPIPCSRWATRTPPPQRRGPNTSGRFRKSSTPLTSWNRENSGCLCICPGKSLSPRSLHRWARMYVLARWWGAPTADAGMQSHSASYPLLATAPRTVPIPRLSNAATFSMSQYFGLTKQTVCTISQNNPERVVASPEVSLCIPAPPPCKADVLAWEATDDAVNALLSNSIDQDIGLVGQCFFNTLRAHPSTSQKPITSWPACSSPSPYIPIPENKSNHLTTPS